VTYNQFDVLGEKRGVFKLVAKSQMVGYRRSVDADDFVVGMFDFQDCNYNG
jgi:hypothetical protein